MSGGEDAE